MKLAELFGHCLLTLLMPFRESMFQRKLGQDVAHDVWIHVDDIIGGKKGSVAMMLPFHGGLKTSDGSHCL